MLRGVRAVSKKEEKKLVYMSSSLVDAATSVSRKISIPLSTFVENSVKVALVLVEELGFSLDYAREVLRVLKSLKVLGGSYLPRPVLEYVERSGAASRDKVAEKWYESGRLYGLYLRESGEDSLKTVKVLLETTRLDLSEVEIVSRGDHYILRCVSTSMTQSETENFVAFIKGLLEAMNFKLLSVEYISGLVVAKFTGSARQAYKEDEAVNTSMEGPP